VIAKASFYVGAMSGVELYRVNAIGIHAEYVLKETNYPFGAILQMDKG